MTERNLVAFEAGELIEIVTPDMTLTPRNRDGWLELQHDPPPLLSPRSEEDRARPFSPVLVQLDPDQRRAIDPRATVAIICGAAPEAARLEQNLSRQRNRRVEVINRGAAR